MMNLRRVDGDSMLPRLSPRDYVLTTSCFKRLNKGDLVVAEHPIYGDLIKRIARVDQIQNTIILKSDNPIGLSSEQMGSFSRKHIRGKVLWIFSAKRL